MANASTLVVSRDNNLYVVGDISILYVKKYRSTIETNNYQVCFAQKINVKTESIAAHSDLTISMYKDEVGHM